jgi:hypothetical protein
VNNQDAQDFRRLQDINARLRPKSDKSGVRPYGITPSFVPDMDYDASRRISNFLDLAAGGAESGVASSTAAQIASSLLPPKAKALVRIGVPLLTALAAGGGTTFLKDQFDPPTPDAQERSARAREEYTDTPTMIANAAAPNLLGMLAGGGFSAPNNRGALVNAGIGGGMNVGQQIAGNVLAPEGQKPGFDPYSLGVDVVGGLTMNRPYARGLHNANQGTYPYRIPPEASPAVPPAQEMLALPAPPEPTVTPDLYGPPAPAPEAFGPPIPMRGSVPAYDPLPKGRVQVGVPLAPETGPVVKPVKATGNSSGSARKDREAFGLVKVRGVVGEGTPLALPPDASNLPLSLSPQTRAIGRVGTPDAPIAPAAPIRVPKIPVPAPAKPAQVAEDVVPPPAPPVAVEAPPPPPVPTPPATKRGRPTKPVDLQEDQQKLHDKVVARPRGAMERVVSRVYNGQEETISLADLKDGELALLQESAGKGHITVTPDETGVRWKIGPGTKGQEKNLAADYAAFKVPTAKGGKKPAATPAPVAETAPAPAPEKPPVAESAPAKTPAEVEAQRMREENTQRGLDRTGQVRFGPDKKPHPDIQNYLDGEVAAGRVEPPVVEKDGYTVYKKKEVAPAPETASAPRTAEQERLYNKGKQEFANSLSKNKKVYYPFLNSDRPGLAAGPHLMQGKEDAFREAVDSGSLVKTGDRDGFAVYEPTPEPVPEKPPVIEESGRGATTFLKAMTGDNSNIEEYRARAQKLLASKNPANKEKADQMGASLRTFSAIKRAGWDVRFDKGGFQLYGKDGKRVGAKVVNINEAAVTFAKETGAVTAADIQGRPSPPSMDQRRRGGQGGMFNPPARKNKPNSAAARMPSQRGALIVGGKRATVPKAPGTITFDGEKEAFKPKYSFIHDALRSPKSIHGPSDDPNATGADRLGETLMAGSIETLSPVIGKQWSKEVTSAQIDFHGNLAKWNNKIGQITELLRADRNGGQGLFEDFLEAGRKKDAERGLKPPSAKMQQEADFVDLIERDKSDPKRKGASPKMQQALDLHDSLTEEWRQYIISTRNKMGAKHIDKVTGLEVDGMDPDWGFTEKGYFRHTFLGKLKLRQWDPATKTWKTSDYYQTYEDAIQAAQDLLKKDPSANFDITGHLTTYGDPSVPLTSKQFHTTVGNLVKSASDTATKELNAAGLPGSVRLTREDVLSDIKGISLAANKSKHIGILMKRMGMDGYSKAYEEVMTGTAYQLVRAQELSLLNRKVTPLMEKERSEGDKDTAIAMQEWMDNMWGMPTRMETLIGNAILNMPGLNNILAKKLDAYEAVALVRGAVQKLTRFQTYAKLAFNPASSLANLTQPLMTLYPYAKESDILDAYKLASDKDFVKVMRERGVLNSSSQLESGGLTLGEGKKSLVEAANFFNRASEKNRAVGYAYGWKQAKGLKDKAGVPYSDEQAHILGLAWADFVEFDNSAWNAAPALRSTFARALFQFKGFEQKNLERMFKAGGAFNLTDKTTVQEKLTRGGKLASALFLTGGANAFGPATLLTGTLVFKYAYETALEAGASEEDAERWATGIQMGLPAALAGVDISRNVAVGNLPYGNDFNERFVNALGPVVSTTRSLVDMGARVTSGELPTVATVGGISPYARALDAFYQAVRSGGEMTMKDFLDPDSTVSKVKVGKDKHVQLDLYDTARRGLLFTPAKLSRYYAVRDARAAITKHKKAGRAWEKVMEGASQALKGESP